MQRRTRFAALGLMVGVFLLFTAARLNAQVQTDTQTSTGQATKKVQVERGEVVDWRIDEQQVHLKFREGGGTQEAQGGRSQPNQRPGDLFT